ncbi:MAG: YveK family protein [Acidimicrobiales bacterium]
MISTRTVAEKALARTNVALSVEDAQREIAATAEVGTQLITVQVVDHDPATAAALANAVADGFVDLINEQERQQSTGTDASKTPAPVSVYEHAVLPTTPEPSSLFRNLLLAAMFGLIVAVGVVVLLEYLDLTIKSTDDAQQRLQLPVLGAIPIDPRLAGA